MSDTFKVRAPVTKRKLPATRLMPKAGELSKAYEYYKKGGMRLFSQRDEPRKRGKDYMTREAIMRAIGQESASAWGHIDKSRNALDLDSAMKLAEILESSVEALFEIHPEAERRIKEIRRDQFRQHRAEREKRWETEMRAFNLPMLRAMPLEVACLIAKADKIVFAVTDEFQRLDLSTAQIADDFPARIEHAKKLGLLTSAKLVEDYLKELSAAADWGVLAGRYVERILREPEADDRGEFDVRAFKVLVLKLSTMSDGVHVLDRSGEHDGECNAERACEHEDYHAFENLAAWTAPYKFWVEVER